MTRNGKSSLSCLVHLCHTPSLRMLPEGGPLVAAELLSGALLHGIASNDVLRYCSRECQEADWNRHRHGCLFEAAREILKESGFPMEIRTMSLHFMYGRPISAQWCSRKRLRGIGKKSEVLENLFRRYLETLTKRFRTRFIRRYSRTFQKKKKRHPGFR